MDMYPQRIDGIEYNEIYECLVHGEFAVNPAGDMTFFIAELWVHGPNGPVRIGDK